MKVTLKVPGKLITPGKSWFAVQSSDALRTVWTTLNLRSKRFVPQTEAVAVLSMLRDGLASEFLLPTSAKLVWSKSHGAFVIYGYAYDGRDTLPFKSMAKSVRLYSYLTVNSTSPSLSGPEKMRARERDSETHCPKKSKKRQMKDRFFSA